MSGIDYETRLKAAGLSEKDVASAMTYGTAAPSFEGGQTSVEIVATVLTEAMQAQAMVLSVS